MTRNTSINADPIRTNLNLVQSSSALLPSQGKDRLPEYAAYICRSVARKPVADFGLASVDQVIGRLIMTVIETCSVGAIVCVSDIGCKRRPLESNRYQLTRALLFPTKQIVDIIIFTTKPQTNLHFLFALVRSALSDRTCVQKVLIFHFPFLSSLREGFTRELCFVPISVDREHRAHAALCFVPEIEIRSWW